ncbi:MAG TPA: EAL domain-containing protein [Acetobacteraceae bacterium]|nr:EAL domain-containing protein [Acetobacteraceae bacterium]
MLLLQNARVPSSTRSQAQLPPPVMRQTLDLAPVGVLVAELRGGEPLVYVNAAFERITGYASADVLGKNCRYLQGSDRLQPEIAQMRAAIASRAEVSVMLRNYRKDGRMFWNQLQMAPSGPPDGAPTHYIGIMQDVTQVKETVERLEQALQLDRLTGLLNRYGFLDRLTTLMAEPAAILLVIKVDVANLHDINTGYGYDIGDMLLQQVADRLRSMPWAAVGRIDADEFAVAVRVGDRDEADSVLARVSGALSQRYVMPGAEISLRFSTGYALGEPGADPLTLVRRAGAALQESRATKLRETRGAEEGSEERSRNRIRLTTELQQALAHQEFAFEYQPKVELATGLPVGAEALLRWKHGLFGQQHPDRFISLAEDTGLILDIGNWGMRKVAGFASEVNQGLARKLSLAVNVSTMEFVHRDLVRSVAEALEQSGTEPGALTLELTESLMAESSPRMLEIFRSLRALGVGLAVDDFGTGYSSLRYLETFPVTEVKIDRSFVQGMCRSAAKRIIVDAIIRLANELEMTVVAEGIETETERAMLRDMGCVYGQGYLFSRPVPPETFLELVRDGSALGPVA